MSSDDPIVADDVAELEFARFAEAMDIDVDPKGLDDEDRSSLESCKRSFLRAVRRGTLSVNENGEPVLRPQSCPEQTVIFKEPKGSAIIARDQRKSGHDQAKMIATMAEITGKPPVFFAGLAVRDFKVCQAITLLFLA